MLLRATYGAFRNYTTWAGFVPCAIYIMLSTLCPTTSLLLEGSYASESVSPWHEFSAVCLFLSVGLQCSHKQSLRKGKIALNHAITFLCLSNEGRNNEYYHHHNHYSIPLTPLFGSHGYVFQNTIFYMANENSSKSSRKYSHSSNKEEGQGKFYLTSARLFFVNRMRKFCIWRLFMCTKVTNLSLSYTWI